MNIAVIPARGGSKRIPRKNVRLFAGKPMITYAIDAARGSGLFEHVVVSTDDEEIAKIAVASGALVPFRRPAELADDYTPTVPVIAHAIKTIGCMGAAAELVCCIYPAVPLIDVADLSRALESMSKTKCGFVFPVTRFPSPIQRALRRHDDGTALPFFSEHVNTRTQDLPAAYYDAGQFYFGRREAWLEGGAIHQNAATIILPEWRVVDIDTPEDWVRAEALFTTLRGHL